MDETFKSDLKLLKKLLDFIADTYVEEHKEAKHNKVSEDENVLHMVASSITLHRLTKAINSDINTATVMLEAENDKVRH